MGKDLHYSIRPFIENALNSHSAVRTLSPINLDDFYAYRIERTLGRSDVILILSDDYYFGNTSLENMPAILKNGGFILLAKPESDGIKTSIPQAKLGIGKLGKLLGALNLEEFWKYEIPEKKK
jgi:hypothetical protein